MSKIFDGDDRAQELGYADFQAFLTLHPKKTRKLKAWNGQKANAPVIQAHINGGRWSVTCWCGQYSYASPKFGFHWCLSCGNKSIGAAVPVVFPEEAERAEIERILLLRPVQDGLSTEPTQAAMQAIALVPGLRRDWYAGQSIDWLMEENLANGVLS
jgi:hypothetical protein